MELWLTDRSRLAVLVASCALLSSMEALFPLFQYRRGRLWRALPNLMLAAGVVLVNIGFASVTAWLSALVMRKHFGLLVPMRSHAWALLVLSVAGLDFFAYLSHVLLHKLPLGWKFHRVHHSEREVDVTTAFRQHPGETLWRVLWQWAGTAAFGLPFWVIPVYLSLSSVNALLEHANLRMSDRLDRCLRLLIVTPNMHKIHHSRLPVETDSNYSNIFSVWDRLCGTHTAWTDCRNLRYGLEGFDDDRKQALSSLVTEPFRRL
jgi:sterol desaturase/sphingolipid hydroxylase (fatty acid hydroxylase superfamily)